MRPVFAANTRFIRRILEIAEITMKTEAAGSSEAVARIHTNFMMPYARRPRSQHTSTPKPFILKQLQCREFN